MKLKNDVLINIVGGATVSGTLVAALVKGLTTVLEIGRNLGTAIKMMISGRKC